MAGRPIEIVIDAKTEGVESGAKNVSDSLEKVEDSLESVETKAKDTGEALEESLGDAASDGAKDVEKGLEKVEGALDDVSDAGKDLDRDLTKALDNVDDTSRKAGSSIGDNIKRGTDRAGSSFDDLKREANSSAEEAASSFDGSAEGIIDTIREIAAEGGASFGLLGGAIGLGIAAGVGIAISKMQGLAEENNEVAQTVSDLSAEYSDLGGVVDNLNIAEKMQEWGREVNEDNWLTFWVDEAETNFQKYNELAEKAGTTTEDTFKGIRGTVEDSEGFLEGTQAEFERLNAEVEAGTEATGKYGTRLTEAGQAAKEKRDALADLRGAAQENIDTTQEAIEVYGIEQDALSGTNDQLHTQIDLKNELSEANASAISSELDYIDTKESVSATLAENGQVWDKNTAKGRENQRAILDLIGETNSYNQSQVEAGESVGATNARLESQRQDLINMVAPFVGSKNAARDYIDQVLKTPSRADTDVNLNGIPDAEEQLNHLARERSTVVDVRADTSSAEYAISRMDGRTVRVHVDAIPRAGQNLIV